MIKNPLVSVIVPNYNHARYLEQRLDSVFGQTYQNFEVIILDDCSTDNSLEVINRYKDNPHLSRIVVNKINSGSVFKQWNKGFSLAKGELIWIAESDDYCELTLLEELVRAIVSGKNIVLAFTSYVFYHEESGRIDRPRMGGVASYSGVHYIKTRMARECFIHNASGVVFRKDVLKKIPQDYMTFKQCGDYMFWTNMCEQGHIVVVNHNLSTYRLHDTSVTSQNETSGVSALEDKRVFDYINSKYWLTLFQKQLVYAAKYRIYTQYIRFSSESKRQEILKAWNIQKRSRKIDRFLEWLVGSMERHTGLLI